MAKRRPAGDGMVRLKKENHWEGRIVVGHKQNGDSIFRYAYARTQKEMMQKLNNLKLQYQDADLNEDSNITLSEWLDRWVNELIPGTVRPTTLKGFELSHSRKNRHKKALKNGMNRNNSFDFSQTVTFIPRFA